MIINIHEWLYYLLVELEQVPQNLLLADKITMPEALIVRILKGRNKRTPRSWYWISLLKKKSFLVGLFFFCPISLVLIATFAPISARAATSIAAAAVTAVARAAPLTASRASAFPWR